jgi:hypothetical protein
MLKFALGSVAQLTERTYLSEDLIGPLTLQGLLERQEYYGILFVNMDTKYLHGLIINITRDNLAGLTVATLSSPKEQSNYKLILFKQYNSFMQSEIRNRENFPWASYLDVYSKERVIDISFSTMHATRECPDCSIFSKELAYRKDFKKYLEKKEHARIGIYSKEKT